MAALTTYTPTRAGMTDLFASCAGGGDTFTNTGSEILIFNNGGASKTLTIVTSGTADGLSIADRTVTLAASKITIVAPMPRYLYGSTVSLTYDAVTSLTVAVVKVTPETV